MKIRSAKKILKIMRRSTDARYFDSEYSIKEDSRFLPRLKYLYNAYNDHTPLNFSKLHETNFR